ncbi:hypothetical protein LMH87_006007 [Akanthomyces muscarius]|uniref:F-box domain-containing protein n=1 Tax=Akanthomyces muscarius TaxID=2231603 RepID=A0A9W8QNP9_AKAMU|nr:hypothetical protein LMH87_006007 [Akanthomyces muscarius]KAJ4164330.1 hypothetical protein LMH87_006007 [Akanthomyces muscarius]
MRTTLRREFSHDTFSITTATCTFLLIFERVANMPSPLKRRQLEESKVSDDTAAQPGLPIVRGTTSHAHQQPSQLARLPHELLVQIIDPILAQDEPMLLLPRSRFVKAKKLTRGSAWSPLVSILLACRAMYFAGVEVFYGRNTLHFVEALHFRKLVETRLNYDQRWSITSVRLTVAWQRGRSSTSPWRLLHDCDSCAEWRDVLERLPKLRRILIRNTTEFNKAELLAQVDMAAFEARMREEIGPEKAGLLTFEWPPDVSETD